MGLKAIVTSVLVALVAAWLYEYNSQPSYLDDSRLILKATLAFVRPARAYLTILGELSGVPAISAINITRSLYNQTRYALEDYEALNVQITEELFDGVPTRVYVPPNAKPNGPAIFNIHGGGWLFLNAVLYDEFCARLAHALGAVVASVEYRLAPEYKYPTPLDDCEASFRYFARNAAKWEVDASRIGVLGDSCGGNLAAALALRLRKKQPTDAKIKLQILFYPMLQIHNFSTPSYRLNPNDYLVPHTGLSIPVAYYALGNSVPPKLQQAGYSNMFEIVAAIQANNHSRSVRTMSKVRKILGDDLYDAVTSAEDREALATLSDVAKAGEVRKNVVEELAGREKVLNEVYETYVLDEEFSPLLAESLEGYPPTYFGLVGYDSLRYDGLMFAERLKRAGTSVFIKEYPKKYHPYAYLESKEMIEDLRRFLEINQIL